MEARKNDDFSKLLRKIKYKDTGALLESNHLKIGCNLIILEEIIMKKYLAKKFKAFTLIEMVVVLFIITLLMLLILPNLTKQKDSAETKTSDALNTTVQTQAVLYKENHEDTDVVTLQMLKDEKYLSDRQYNQAVKHHIEIEK